MIRPAPIIDLVPGRVVEVSTRAAWEFGPGGYVWCHFAGHW